MIELTISILVLTVVMGAMMQFMGMMQQRYTRQQRVSGASQTGKMTLELLAIDVGQAGYYPGVQTTAPAAIAAGSPSAVLASVAGIYVGTVLIVDIGLKQETVRVTAVDPSTNTVSGLFAATHSTAPVAVRTTEAPYAEGILLRKDSAATDFSITSTQNMLKIMGDLRDDATLRYVEYRFTAGADCTGVLERSDSTAFAPGDGTTKGPWVLVADRICNDATAGVFSYTTPCPQVSTFSYLTYVPASSPCPATGAFTYVTSVTLNMTLRTPPSTERGGGGPTTMNMRQTFLPRNILYALRIAQDGLQELLPVRPASVPVL